MEEEEEEEEELHAHKPGIVQHQSTLEFRIPNVLSPPLCSLTLILSSKKIIHNKPTRSSFFLFVK